MKRISQLLPVNVILLLCVLQILPAQSRKIPDLRLETLENEMITVDEFLTKGPVYISFWALWCEPCKTELKSLQKFQESYGKDGLSILAINRDSQKSLAKVSSYIAAKGYTFNVFLDPDSEVFERLNGEALPYSLLVARDGTIAHVYTGFLPGDEKKIDAEIRKLLTPEEAHPDGRD